MRNPYCPTNFAFAIDLVVEMVVAFVDSTRFVVDLVALEVALVFVVAWNVVEFVGLLQEVHLLVVDYFLSFETIRQHLPTYQDEGNISTHLCQIHLILKFFGLFYL